MSAALQTKLQDTLGRAIGHTLQKIVASVHLFGAEGLDGPPLCLWFFFDVLPAFRLTGAPDGWSLQVDETLPESVHLGESGDIVLCDMAQRSLFEKAIGQVLHSAWSIQSPPHGTVIGVRLDFGPSVQPLVLNWGDELYMAEHYPDDADEDTFQEISIFSV